MSPNEHVTLIERTLAPLSPTLVNAATGIVRIEIVVLAPRESFEVFLLTEGDEPSKHAHFRAIQTAELALKPSLPEGLTVTTSTMPIARFADYARIVEACNRVREVFLAGRAKFSFSCTRNPIAYAPGKTTHYIEWTCARTDDIPDESGRNQIIEAMKSQARELGYGDHPFQGVFPAVFARRASKSLAVDT